MAWRQWRPYVSVARRRGQAARKMDALRKKGVDIQPIHIKGRKIARTFWGEAWCHHLESFSDFDNRLPRGRTYVRNGSVCHLEIAKGKIQAKVMGSELYKITIQIKTLPKKKWKAVKDRCAGRIGSLIELLKGDLSDNIMSVVTDRKNGLFPLPGEISLDCNCPDWAVMCKHVAAALYGVGARLDETPSLLFVLRGVDHAELIVADAEAAMNVTTASSGGPRLDDSDLSAIFGVDIAAEDAAKTATATPEKTSRKKRTTKKRAAKKVTAKKVTVKKTPAAKAKKRGPAKPAKKTAKKKKAVRKTASTAKKTVKKAATTTKKAVKKATRKKSGTTKATESASRKTSTAKKVAQKAKGRRKAAKQ